MWGITSLRKCKPARSFAAAAELFDSIKPMRGKDESHPRRLGRRGDRNMVVYKRVEDGRVGYAFRLYYTDMVTWWDDGSVDICPHSSVLSRQFFDLYAPSGIALNVIRDQVVLGFAAEADANGRYGMETEAGEMVYFVDHWSHGLRHTFRSRPCGYWRYDGTPAAVSVTRLDRVEASAALKLVHYRALAGYIRTTEALLGGDQSAGDAFGRVRARRWSSRHVANAWTDWSVLKDRLLSGSTVDFRDPGLCADVFSCREENSELTTDDFLEGVRKLIYSRHCAIKKTYYTFMRASDLRLFARPYNSRL